VENSLPREMYTLEVKAPEKREREKVSGKKRREAVDIAWTNDETKVKERERGRERETRSPLGFYMHFNAS